MHQFAESLEKSHKADEHAFWEQCYRQAFPSFAGMNNSREDGEHQRKGIDRLVFLSNNKTFLIDEKIRFTKFNDIALEFEHVYNNGVKTKGWVCKPLLCDFIAYAIAPLGKCYLLPTTQLQQAWRRFNSEWLTTYQVIESKNQGYISRSLCIPANKLYPAIGQCLRAYFDPMEE